MVKHIYTCDICGKEISNSERKVIVPTIGYGECEHLDACNECISEINKAIDAKISELSNGAVVIERR